MLRQGFWTDRSLIDAARELRSANTEAERALWCTVRNRNIGGLKFRRQHQIENFIVDFVCLELKLIVELDGEGHFTEEMQKYDTYRTERLQQLGFTILRFENGHMLLNGWHVRQTIERTAEDLRKLSG
jgi:very-short-patch-repair endonuclease